MYINEVILTFCYLNKSVTLKISVTDEWIGLMINGDN